MGKETVVLEMEDKPKISGVTTADIESIQVYLCLKDGRMLVGKTDNRIIKKHNGRICSICRSEAGIDT